MPSIKENLRKRRQARIRAKISGTAERPRLAIHRSLSNISAQLIDDTTGKTIASASSAKGKGKPVEQAANVGKDLAKAAKAKKVTTCVFDRGGYKYHGRVKALADGAREGGLEF